MAFLPGGQYCPELSVRLADQGYCKEGWWSAARADFVAMLDNYKPYNDE